LTDSFPHVNIRLSNVRLTEKHEDTSSTNNFREEGKISFGSVKRFGNAIILSGAECMICDSHDTRRCPLFSDNIVDAFVCRKCCLSCKERQRCPQPAWKADGIAENAARKKYDSFPEDGTTRCCDCNKILTTSKGERVEDAYFYHGVRCRECYQEYIKSLSSRSRSEK